MRDGFWKVRAKQYDRLEWVRKKEFMDRFVGLCGLSGGSRVLDVGTGTGAVAHAVATRARSVIGIDISRDMVAQARAKGPKNVSYRLVNAERLPFPSNSFDVVTARMVFHHVDRVEQAMREVKRVLKPGGRLVLCEGVPPDEFVKARFIRIFRLKEKRHTFSESTLINFFNDAGFEEITLFPYFMRRVSMKNWLVNSGLPDAVCRKIVKLHTSADRHFKRVYALREIQDDIVFDWRFAMIRGVKPKVR